MQSGPRHGRGHKPEPAAVAPVAPGTATPGPPPAPGAFEEIGEPPGPPEDEPKGSGAGRPTGLVPGAPEGVWIWHDAAGWHLRTTTARNPHQFRGTIWGMKGDVGNVKVVRAEQGDRFRKKGNRLFFDYRTNGHEDGVDFMIAESDCALVNITVDGRAQPDRVRSGGQGVSPKRQTFKVCQ